MGMVSRPQVELCRALELRCTWACVPDWVVGWAWGDDLHGGWGPFVVTCLGIDPLAQPCYRISGP